MIVTPFSLVPVSVLADTRLTLAEHRVLGALFSFRSSADTWHVWPSRQSIAARCGISSPDHVSRILARLKGKGWIDIQRRRGSSLYHLSPDGRPPRPAHPCADVDLRTHAQIEETQGEETNLPPDPLSGGEVVSEILTTVEPVIVEIQPDPLTNSSPTETAPKSRPERIEAAQRVVGHLNAKTGAQLDTRAHSATVKRAARRLRHHTEQDLVEVIEAKGREFRHPAALLKQSIIEAILSERRQREAADQRRRQREAEQLAQVAVPVNATPAGARAGIAAVRAALGCRLTC